MRHQPLGPRDRATLPVVEAVCYDQGQEDSSISEADISATAVVMVLVPITYDQLLKELGQLSLTFNVLETIVSHRTWELISPDQRIGRTVTAKMTFASLVDLLRDLYMSRYTEPEKQAQMKDLHAALRAGNDRRNILLHTSWGLMKADPIMVSRFKLRFTGAGGLTQMELRSAIGEVREATNELLALTNRAFGLSSAIVAIGGP